MAQTRSRRRPCGEAAAAALSHRRGRSEEAAANECVRTRESRPVRNGAAAAARSDSRAHGLVLRQRPLRDADAIGSRRWSLERGFRSFLDFYYLLKYDDAGADAAWRRGDGRAVGPGNLLLARDRSDHRRWPATSCPSWSRAQPRTPVRIWSAPCATGEEPLTDCDGRSRRRAGSTARRIEIHAQRRQPGGHRQGAQRDVPRARRSARCRRSCARSTSIARRRVSAPMPALRRRITSWSVVNLMAREEIAAVARQPDRLLPQRIHLFLAGQRQAGGRGVRRARCRARVSVRRGVRVAAEASPIASMLEELDRRVRVRQAVTRRS